MLTREITVRYDQRTGLAKTDLLPNSAIAAAGLAAREHRAAQGLASGIGADRARFEI